MILFLKKIIKKVLVLSLNSACKEQGLSKLAKKLSEIVPDLTEQYTDFDVEGKYLITKVRSHHAFQMALVLEALDLLEDKDRELTVVDIGDSSGTHLQYLQALIGKNKIRPVSVNLDPIAVEKIKSKGLEAIESRAEMLHEHPDFSGRVDIFLSFQMLEHLLDPIGFLHAMALKSECDYFVITVPYLHQSRVGLYQVRDQKLELTFNAERTHIFELCSDDWDIIFRFSGWKIVKSVRYIQYPRKNPLTGLRYVWRKFDFDGFYGVILKKDDSISKRYLDW
jgi:2-polyprenyl-3-methyl-5-hydroxy-6-metoxy-1,4-benzoquinol methylase